MLRLHDKPESWHYTVILLLAVGYMYKLRELRSGLGPMGCTHLYLFC